MHNISGRNFRWPQLGPALFQLHTDCLKANFGRSITDFCMPAIIHDHLFFYMFWFICLFVEYSILYLSQLNFIWQDEKHVTSADQILLILVPSTKLSTKILFFFFISYANSVTWNLSFFSLIVNAILNRSNYIHSQKIHYPQNSLSEWNETNYQNTSKLLQIIMNAIQLIFPC